MPPRIIARLFRWLFLLFTTGFIVIQLNVLLSSELTPASDESAVDAVKHGKEPEKPKAEKAKAAQPVVPDEPVDSDKVIRDFLAERMSHNGGPPVSSTPSAGLHLSDIRLMLDGDNRASRILNEPDRFSPLTLRDSNAQIDCVIVVQVHNRANYLSKLIDSFRVSRNIERTLIVFSHDFYSPEINSLVRNITFARVMQIFYPLSIQLTPYQFPGADPKDCLPEMTKEQATAAKCQNYKHPDKYNHYRNARIVQIKHHWWWKTNFVFDGIPQLRNYTGYYIFLEEDHYVSPDFLHVLAYMTKNLDTLCKECRMLALGFYLKTYNGYAGTINKLSVAPWFSSRHNMGMVFNRKTWAGILDCANLFCTYDDYNWDWSLQHVNLKCLKPGPMSVLYTKSPRIFHVGDCGIHHSGKVCTADKSANVVQELLSKLGGQLYPNELSVADRSKKTLKPPKENGGWGDKRDHALCLNHTIHNPASKAQLSV